MLSRESPFLSISRLCSLSSCTINLLNAEDDEQPSMSQYSQHAGLSSIEDWGYSETQNEAPPAACIGSSSQVVGQQQQCFTHDGCQSQCPIGDNVGTNVGVPKGDVQRPHTSSTFLFGGPAWSGGPVRSPDNAHVIGPMTDVPRASVVTGHRQLSSPVSPVGGFQIGLREEDEVTLRQHLRMRAMAMSDGLSLSPDERDINGIMTSPARNGGSRHGSPGPSTVSSVDNDTMGCRSSHLPAALSAIPHASFPLSPDPFRRDGSPQPHRPRTGSLEYVINRIIRANEAGVPPVDCPTNTTLGGEAVVDPTAPWRTPPPRVPFEGLNSPSPVTAQSTSQHTPCNVENLAGTNEVKSLMGEETEPLGRARLKAGFWKDVEQRMKGKGFNRNAHQCKNKFNTLLDYYRRLKVHEGWSGLPSYWDMNQTRRKKYNIDFVLRRAWYDIIHPVGKDKDSIYLTNLMDSGADEERLEDSERCNDIDGETEGGSEDPAVGSASSLGLGSSQGGRRSTGFDPMLSKRRRTAINARELSMQTVTSATCDHTAALTCSDRECMKICCEATRDIARHQAEAHRELMQQDIPSRERIATITGDGVEKGYLVLADAIRSLRPRRNSPSSRPDSSDSR
ncbi:hypothetical protein CBR_g34433 [Chara braunii]|uniref:Myb/SANT-like DNA-binding domain-containing protein n=1 Tax=Chara braunii TaxID=69332 RepID=A0A388LIV8_CHABU|nr:hypothetical protein CBR_g34433 [Chara braunii]|eukprot:GBG82152.1 hypothetical protein CBR_g34433 [Chara braunii]